ncbi:MAG: hypothetical protein HON55_00555 [Legionellales bacterium]|jgi:hypothetical protein|nr:hypothetical protein [Legionellales bacterium]
MKPINYLVSLELEEKILATNWLLFILTWLIFFGVISGSVLPIVLISITPILGYFMPSIVKNIKEYFFKDNDSDDQNTNSSKIDINKDSSLKATSKFILHSFININILYYSIKTLLIAYGLASASGVCGLLLSGFILLTMLPIVLKEFLALRTVYENAKYFENYNINKANLLKSMSLAIIISTVVFFILCAVSTWLLIHLASVYPYMIFIVPLVTIEFLLLVTYLSYVTLNNKNINKWEVTCNIITFIGGTFSLLFALFELSAATGVINIAALTHMSIYLAAGAATIQLLFPIIVVFSLATIAFLIKAPAITTESDAKPDKTPGSENDENHPFLGSNIDNDNKYKQSSELTAKPKDNLDTTQKYNNTENNPPLVNRYKDERVTPVTAASLSIQPNNGSPTVSKKSRPIPHKEEEVGQQPALIN